MDNGSTVGFYSTQFASQGGIERVCRELVRIFAEHGVRCWMISEFDGAPWADPSDNYVLPRDAKSRQELWRDVLQKRRPDCMVFHHVGEPYHAQMLKDIASIRSLGVRCVAVSHAPFNVAMLLAGDERMNRRFLQVAACCDQVATVSEMDAQWWRALGCCAMHVQNPFVHPRRASAAEVEAEGGGGQGTVNLLWVGRNTEQKGPDLAIEVLANVVKDAPNAHLTMVGGSDAGWQGVRRQAEKLGVTDKVTCFGQRDDLNDLWDKADIHLLTSVTESFCLVLAEAKAKGIPTAMFEIPFLELVESGKGLVTAPQGDVAALAAGIVELVKNSEKRRQLGKEARESLTVFNDEAVWKSWNRALLESEISTKCDESFRIVATQMSFAWERYCDKNLWLVRMHENAKKLSHGLIDFRFIAKLLDAGVNVARRIKRR